MEDLKRSVGDLKSRMRSMEDLESRVKLLERAAAGRDEDPSSSRPRASGSKPHVKSRLH